MIPNQLTLKRIFRIHLVLIITVLLTAQQYTLCQDYDLANSRHLEIVNGLFEKIDKFVLGETVSLSVSDSVYVEGKILSINNLIFSISNRQIRYSHIIRLKKLRDIDGAFVGDTSIEHIFDNKPIDKEELRLILVKQIEDTHYLVIMKNDQKVQEIRKSDKVSIKTNYGRIPKGMVKAIGSAAILVDDTMVNLEDITSIKRFGNTAAWRYVAGTGLILVGGLATSIAFAEGSYYLVDPPVLAAIGGIVIAGLGIKLMIPPGHKIGKRKTIKALKN